MQSQELVNQFQNIASKMFKWSYSSWACNGILKVIKLLNQNWSIRYRIPFYEILVKETQKVSKPTQAIVTVFGYQL